MYISTSSKPVYSSNKLFDGNGNGRRRNALRLLLVDITILIITISVITSIQTKGISMAKFKGKYSIESMRLQKWNYSGQGAYFITINTKNRIHYFGKIVSGKMHLSKIGKMVENEWLKTFEMRPDMNLQNGAFVVMPDHVHALLKIGENEYNARDKTVWYNGSLNQFGPQSKNLASVIRGFKIGVSVNARTLNPDFAWQSLYHDCIIWSDKSYQRVKNYIINNPKNW